MNTLFKYFLLIALLIFCNQLSAQIDSLKVDTVIIIQEPLILRKQVYLGDGSGAQMSTKVKNKNSHQYFKNITWHLTGTFGFGNSQLFKFDNDQKISLNSYRKYGFGITAGFKQFLFSMGIGSFTTGLNYSVYNDENRSKQESVTVYDYSHASTTILPGRIIYKGVITRDSSYTVNYTVLAENRKQTQIIFLTVPLSIGYRMNMENRKWFIMPELNICPAFTLKQKHVQEVDSPKEIFWMYGGMLSLGRDFSPKLLLHTYLQFQNTFNGVYTNHPDSRIKLTGFGIGVMYRII
ncbi:MAG: hypothetical protein H7329_13170 [Opitutaceae bacterium]|nr:hypothetical protein [Cytophagales bacterium]